MRSSESTNRSTICRGETIDESVVVVVNGNSRSSELGGGKSDKGEGNEELHL